MAKIYVYKDKEYRRVNRNPETGDLVIYFGMVGEFRYTDGIYNIVNYGGSISGRDAWNVDDCQVLEPLESEEVTVDGTQASPQVIDMLANLARRVNSLERQLADTQRNVETWAEQTESVKRTYTTSEELDYVHNLAESTAERLDMLTMDARSQVLNAINKYYAEGSR